MLVDTSLVNASAGAAIFHYAHLEKSNFTDAKFNWSTLSNANLTNANLTGADLEDAIFQDAILIGANISGVQYWKSAYFIGADITHIINPPDGFISWALDNGAVKY